MAHLVTIALIIGFIAVAPRLSRRFGEARVYAVVLGLGLLLAGAVVVSAAHAAGLF